MSHWAELDENNIVLRVTVGDNNEPDEGYQWLINNLGGKWVKTSYNSYRGKRQDPETSNLLEEPGFRYNFAAVGDFYDEERDAFIPQKPTLPKLDEEDNVINGEWVLDPETCCWVWE